MRKQIAALPRRQVRPLRCGTLKMALVHSMDFADEAEQKTTLLGTPSTRRGMLSIVGEEKDGEISKIVAQMRFSRSWAIKAASNTHSGHNDSNDIQVDLHDTEILEWQSLQLTKKTDERFSTAKLASLKEATTGMFWEESEAAEEA